MPVSLFAILTYLGFTESRPEHTSVLLELWPMLVAIPASVTMHIPGRDTAGVEYRHCRRHGMQAASCCAARRSYSVRSWVDASAAPPLQLC